MKRSATARWMGNVKEGTGTLTTKNKVLDSAQYSFRSRFEDGKGTNPEELIAAAHAGCFAMKLSGNLTEAGYPPQLINAQCEITLDNGEITQSHITVEVQAEGLHTDKFNELVEDAKDNCPISKLLNAEISVEQQLIVGAG